MKQTRDELEYAISQYLDGTLLPLELNTLEERLAADAEARALLEEYRALNSSLKAMPLPAVAWDRLASEISHSLESEEMPVRHYSLGMISWTQRLAIAAMLLVSISLAAFLINSPKQPGNPLNPTVSKPDAVAVISGPTAEQSKGTVVAEVSVGPSPSIAQGNWRATEDVVSRPTVVLIDQARSSGQDTEPSPY